MGRNVPTGTPVGSKENKSIPASKCAQAKGFSPLRTSCSRSSSFHHILGWVHLLRNPRRNPSCAQPVAQGAQELYALQVAGLMPGIQGEQGAVLREVYNAREFGRSIFWLRAQGRIFNLNYIRGVLRNCPALVLQLASRALILITRGQPTSLC